MLLPEYQLPLQGIKAQACNIPAAARDGDIRIRPDEEEIALCNPRRPDFGRIGKTEYLEPLFATKGVEVRRGFAKHLQVPRAAVQRRAIVRVLQYRHTVAAAKTRRAPARSASQPLAGIRIASARM